METDGVVSKAPDSLRRTNRYHGVDVQLKAGVIRFGPDGRGGSESAGGRVGCGGVDVSGVPWFLSCD